MDSPQGLTRFASTVSAAVPVTFATRLVKEYGPLAGPVTVKVTDIGVPPHVSVYTSLLAVVGVKVVIPLVASAPLHAPLAVHEVAPIDDHVRTALWPRVIELLFRVSVTVGATAAPLPPEPPPPQAASAKARGSTSARSGYRTCRIDVQAWSRIIRVLKVRGSFDSLERPRA